MAREGGNNRIDLAFGTSIVMYRDEARMPGQMENFRGLNVMPAGVALARVSPTYFEKNRASAEIILRLTNEREIARGLLEFGKAASANRVLGALGATGQEEKARKVMDVLTAARMEVKPENPFPDSNALIAPRLVIRSPYAARIHALWTGMRAEVIENFPKPPSKRPSKESYLHDAEEIYTNDCF